MECSHSDFPTEGHKMSVEYVMLCFGRSSKLYWKISLVNYLFQEMTRIDQLGPHPYDNNLQP